MAGARRLRVELEGVPETLLWTLYHRAVEAGRPDAVIRDPLALSLVERIDYPFAARFGEGGLGQWQAARALTFDREGLETQFWRVDDGRIRWVTVDLPEVIDLRERLLPPSPRRRSVAGSALEPAWIDEVAAGPAEGVLVTAQGLLMYLDRDEAHGLVATCARRLPGAAMVFDTVPRWLAERSRGGGLPTGPGGYVPPPWRWGLDATGERALAALPGVAELRALHPPRGRGALHGLLLPALNRLPPVRRRMLSIHRARFAP